MATTGGSDTHATVGAGVKGADLMTETHFILLILTAALVVATMLPERR